MVKLELVIQVGIVWKIKGPKFIRLGYEPGKDEKVQSLSKIFKAEPSYPNTKILLFKLVLIEL